MLKSSCRAVKLKNAFCRHLLLADRLADGASAVNRVEKSSGMSVRLLPSSSAARRQASVGSHCVKISGMKQESFTVKKVFLHHSLFFFDLSNTFSIIHNAPIRIFPTRKSTQTRFTCNLILTGTQRKLTSVCSYRFCCSSTNKCAAVKSWFSHSRSLCRHNHNLLLGLRSLTWERNQEVFQHLWCKARDL